MLVAALNVSAMTWRTSPAATELETLVLDWLRQMLGLPADFTGVVYDTASVAVLHALAAPVRISASKSARGVYAGDPKSRFADLHFRSCTQLGRESRHHPRIGRTKRASCGDDASFRMSTSALRRAIEEDFAGRTPSHGRGRHGRNNFVDECRPRRRDRLDMSRIQPMVTC